MIVKREHFLTKCDSCSGNGKIYDADQKRGNGANEIIVIRQCTRCHGTGEMFTEEGEAIYNLLVAKGE